MTLALVVFIVLSLAALVAICNDDYDDFDPYF